MRDTIPSAPNLKQNRNRKKKKKKCVTETPFLHFLHTNSTDHSGIISKISEFCRAQ